MKIRLLTILIALLSIIACDSYNQIERKLYRIQEDGKYGFIDAKGDVQISPQYEYASHFFNGYSTVAIECSTHNDTLNALPQITRCITYNYIDESGKLLLDQHLTYKVSNMFESSLPDYHDILYNLRFESNLAVYRNEEGLYGFINTKGNIKIPCEYDDARAFSDKKAAINKRGDGWGFINIDGTIFIKPQYFSVQDYNHGLASASILVADAEFHETSVSFPKVDQVVLDGNGRIIGTPKSMYRQFSTFSEDSIALVQHLLVGLLGYQYVDASGDFLPTQESPVIENREYANFIIETNRTNPFLDAGEFSEGYAPVSFTGDLYLYIDKYFVPKHDGNNIYTYEKAYTFAHGLAAVKKEGKWGFINKKFEEVIPCQYDSCRYYFEGELARVYTKAENYTIESYINKQNQTVWQMIRKNN